MPRASVGDKRHRVTVWTPNPVAGEYLNEEEDSPAKFATVWAKVEWGKSEEYEYEGQRRARGRVTLTINHLPGLTPEHYVTLEDGTQLNITGINPVDQWHYEDVVECVQSLT